jgi:hypothetical protein
VTRGLFFKKLFSAQAVAALAELRVTTRYTRKKPLKLEIKVERI